MSANTSIASLTAALETITDSIATLKVAVEEMQKQQQVPVAAVDELAPFHAWLQVELTPYFGAKDAKLISNELNLSRQKGDFRFFCPTYPKVTGGDLQKTELLRTVSAVYRYKFGGFKRSEKYALRSEIKRSSGCPLCGALSQILLDRLIAEGLWK
ncbi:MAG: hypothetical protein FJ167_09855 [Gammaproteobacteria bacterium]|nr:hypothetical protein [Gammaproteobacteria bacterium]